MWKTKVREISIPGLTLKGNEDALAQALRLYGLNPSDYGINENVYWSESKGEYIKLDNMADEHLMNAILKQIRNGLDGLRDLELVDFHERVYDYYQAVSVDLDKENNPVLTKLVDELERRLGND